MSALLIDAALHGDADASEQSPRKGSRLKRRIKTRVRKANPTSPELGRAPFFSFVPPRRPSSTSPRQVARDDEAVRTHRRGGPPKAHSYSASRNLLRATSDEPGSRALQQPDACGSGISKINNDSAATHSRGGGLMHFLRKTSSSSAAATDITSATATRRIVSFERKNIALLSTLYCKGPLHTIYRACVDGGFVVAVKTTELAQFEDEEIAAFHSNAKLVCQLEHRHVVAHLGYAFDRARGELLLVQELLDGDLESEHARVGGWQPTELAMLMAKVASALAYLHGSVRLIHRDVKPSNVFFRRLLNGSLEIKLGDFDEVRKVFLI